MRSRMWLLERHFGKDSDGSRYVYYRDPSLELSQFSVFDPINKPTIIGLVWPEEEQYRLAWENYIVRFNRCGKTYYANWEVFR